MKDSRNAIICSQFTLCQKFYCNVLATESALDDSKFTSRYRELGDDAIWAFAESEGATSIIGERLRSVLGEAHTRQRWLDAVEVMEQRIGLYMEQLDCASEALAKEEIRLVALKNSGIARELHTKLASNPMGNLGVLVTPREFQWCAWHS